MVADVLTMDTRCLRDGRIGSGASSGKPGDRSCCYTTEKQDKEKIDLPPVTVPGGLVPDPQQISHPRSEKPHSW